MIKICYIIGHLGKGGAEKQLYKLVKGINREMFEPVVISLNQGGFWSREVPKLNIQVIELQRKKSFEFIRLFKLIKLLKVIKPDIVHTYMFSANSYGRIAAIITRVPTIIASERNIVEAGKGVTKYWIYVDKLLASFTHGIICNSHKSSKSLVEKYSFNAKKVFTVHNGINAMEFLEKTDFHSKKKSTQKVVGTIGRLYPQKNHKLFLNMTNIVLDKIGNKEIKFLIVGEGPLGTELKKYSKDLGIESNVVFLGERNDIPDLLQRMDVFVMTSLYEGMSNAIMEAMTAGLPVVATDVGGNSELAVDGETGCVVPPNDPEAMAQKVLYLLKNEKMAKEMGERGRKRAEKEFNMEKMISKTEEVYEKLMTGKCY